MTGTKLRPICYPCNEDKDLFDHLRDERTVMWIVAKLTAIYDIAPRTIRRDWYIECDKPTPRNKAEALFSIIAYHLDMNVIDVRALVFWSSTPIYRKVLKFATKLPWTKRKAKDSEDIDTTIHGWVADNLAELYESQKKAMNAICDDRTKHHEDEED